VWRRSTDQAEVPPAALPGGPDGPPAWAPPPGPSQDQRRFNFFILGLMLVLVAALAGGLIVYTHIHEEHQAAAQTKADVLHSYLDYYSALEQAYRELNPAPLKPFVTGAGLQQELPVLNQSIQSGSATQVVAVHHPQVVVYRGDQLASVDDVIVRHLTPLAPNSMAPSGPERTDIIHQSSALEKQNGRWLVTSVFAFGFGAPEGKLGISYAADPASPTLGSSVAHQILTSYMNFWQVRDRCLVDLRSSSLKTVEIGPELSIGEATLRDDRAKNEGFHVSAQHNIRLGEQDGTTMWVYDTFLSSASRFKFSSGKLLGPAKTQLVRQAFRFRKVGKLWKADLDILEQ
jgi:hypothetical protein